MIQCPVCHANHTNAESIVCKVCGAITLFKPDAPEPYEPPKKKKRR